MADISASTITIDAPADLVWKAISTIEAYPEWSTSTKSVAVESRDEQGRAQTVKMSIDAGVMRDQVVLEYDWSKAPSEISFSLDDADLLTEMTGSFHIKDNGDETTDVTYSLTVALSMPVPAMMRTKAEKATIDFSLAQLKKFLEG
jgi:uncharacterized protein YndB with AHSA1/START domain